MPTKRPERHTALIDSLAAVLFPFQESEEEQESFTDVGRQRVDEWLEALLTARAQEIEQVKAQYVRMVQLHTDEEVDKYRWMQRAELAEAALVSRAPQQEQEEND